jgi:hypothetical protein
VELTAPRELVTLARWDTLDVGATNTITGSLRGGQGEALQAKMTARVAEPPTNGRGPFTFVTLDLYDDGAHNDGAANDGVFANEYMARHAGWHPFFVQATGDGFAREDEGLFAVSSKEAYFDASPARLNGDRLLELSVTAAREGPFAVAIVARQGATPQVVGGVVHPVSLKEGTQRVRVELDRLSLPRGEYSLDLILLDAFGAAFELDRSPAPVSFTVR